MGGLDFSKIHVNLPNKGTPHKSVRTTGRGHYDGIHGAGALNRIYLPKGAWSQICQNHGAGALDRNLPP